MNNNCSLSGAYYNVQWIKDVIDCAYKHDRRILDVPKGSLLLGDNSDSLMQSLQRVILRGSARMSGAREKTCHPEHLAFPRLFRPTLQAQHLKNFRKKISENKEIKWVFSGDSILSIGADIVSPSESPVYTWSDEIKRQNFGAKINFYNLSIPATRWDDMASDTECPAWWPASQGILWLDYIIGLKPDVMVFWFGGNDSENINPSAMDLIIGRIEKELPGCDILLCVTYLPSSGTPEHGYATVEGQHGRMISQNYTRSYAAWRGKGFLDFGRWHRMVRDGYDPCEMSLTRIEPSLNSDFPSFEKLYKTQDKRWFFPTCANDNLVYANQCTDWAIGFSFSEFVRKFSFPLSGLSCDARPNRCHVTLEEGRIVVLVENGIPGDCRIKVDTEFYPRTDRPSFFSIILKNNRLTISTPHNDWNPDAGSVILGGGFVDIFDMHIPRFGGRYHPYLETDTDQTLTVYNLCVADSSRADGGCTRFMPCMSDLDLFQRSFSAGGSNQYHQNTNGVRETLAPVIRQENWCGLS
ncbi:hypothetical protein AA14337_0932 [Acetobacter malorum DSM 14337]|uniref:SGNH hydrolase-type esterase domain-containing protein n=1 Tax=Acetobacter malorum DSM 14337 TaxID=1307910 RepID=A0ABQ0PPW7_9PROT|nr:SGNH/GDSL hydrolase family protein [Acetobacter malorum]GBQ77823.1 hypothetical protein AA14337_0932 [Acetobacter malorum DSM 14337]